MIRMKLFRIVDSLCTCGHYSRYVASDLNRADYYDNCGGGRGCIPHYTHYRYYHNQYREKYGVIYYVCRILAKINWLFEEYY